MPTHGLDPQMMQELQGLQQMMEGTPEQQVRELVAPLSEEEQQALVQKLEAQYGEFQRSVSQLHKNIDRYHELYEAAKPDTKEFPWPEASNFMVPLIMSTVDSLHARMVKSVFDVDPIWLSRPRTREGVGSATKAQWYLDYWADEIGVRERMDMIFLNALIEGVGVAKVDWVRKQAQLPSPEAPANPFMPAQEGAQVVTEYDGPNITHIPLKDFVLIPGDAPTIDDAVYVGHRVFRTQQQLQERQDALVYFNVDRLLAKSKGDDTADRTPHPSDLVSPSSADQHEETNQYEIIELYGPYDFGDGPQPALMTFSAKHKILLRLEPYPYEYGRAPYIAFIPYPRANFFWGRSVPEYLESAQEELTALHNMRADSIVRRIAPPILRQRGSQWEPDEQPWKPHQVIEVADMGEIAEMPLQDLPQGVFAHEQDLMAFVERVTGMSDYFMGRSPTQSRTATEVNRVTSEGLARMDVIISRVQISMKKLAWVLWWMLYQYRPHADFFYAENTEMTIMKYEMRPAPNGLMPFEFIPHGKLSDASKEALRQQKLMLYQIAAPTLQQFYPDGIRYMLMQIFQEFDVHDRDNVVGPSWNMLQQQLQQAYQQGLQEGVQQGAQAQQDG